VPIVSHGACAKRLLAGGAGPALTHTAKSMGPLLLEPGFHDLAARAVVETAGGTAGRLGGGLAMRQINNNNLPDRESGDGPVIVKIENYVTPFALPSTLVGLPPWSAARGPAT